MLFLPSALQYSLENGTQRGSLLKSWDSVYQSIRRELARVIVGQDEAIDLLLVCLLSGGHGLLEGVPGLAKTLLVQSLSRVLDLSFNRIQFTPDMVPSDITGTEVLYEGKNGRNEFRFIQGPVFSHIILADEINRTTPKTQSALLQAMQESQVSLLGKTYPLPDPFYVLATQNPIEYEGTYPLPEAQLDRFLLFIEMGYPDREHELQIIDADPADLQKIQPVMDATELKKWMAVARELHVSDSVKNYALSLVRASRPGREAPDFVNEYLEWGCGPRASQMLVRASRAHAFLQGKKMVDKSDVDAVLVPSLQHRIIPNYRARAEKVSLKAILKEIKGRIEAKI